MDSVDSAQSTVAQSSEWKVIYKQKKNKKAFALMKSFAYYAKHFAQSTGDIVKKTNISIRL